MNSFFSVVTAASVLAMVSSGTAEYSAGSTKNIAVYWAPANLAAFGAKLRGLMDGASGRRYYLSAAPQCVFPDAAVGELLNAVPFDFVSIQFYNNWCGVVNFVENSTTQNAYNFDVWSNWARGSKNPKVKLLVGVPAAAGAGGGYTDGSKLQDAIRWSQTYSNFGGVMMWDMSQLWANSGFLDEVVGDMRGGPSLTNAASNSAPNGGAGRPQWAQCGGQGYTGPTVCAAPYKCVMGGAGWSSCQ